MAKQRGRPKGSGKPSGTGDKRAIVLSIKGTVEFRDWLAGLARRERITTVQLLEKAVVEYAERREYPISAPERTGGR